LKRTNPESFMETVLIVIHLMVVLALVGVVLLQRSEGGALGIGGGGGFMSARGAANALTRTTAILAAAFFATSIGLGVLAKVNTGPGNIIRQIEQQQPAGSGGVLDQLGGAPAQQQTAPAVPAAPEQPAQQAPAAGSAPAAPATPQVPSGQ
jgi:preprotein translocase subunit SecG